MAGTVRQWFELLSSKELFFVHLPRALSGRKRALPPRLTSPIYEMATHFLWSDLVP